MTQIIPITQHRERECILVEGKKFCETPEISKRELGLTILVAIFFAAITLYGIFRGIGRIDEDGDKRWFLVAASPTLVLLAWLFLS